MKCLPLVANGNCCHGSKTSVEQKEKKRNAMQTLLVEGVCTRRRATTSPLLNSIMLSLLLEHCYCMNGEIKSYGLEYSLTVTLRDPKLNWNTMVDGRRRGEKGSSLRYVLKKQSASKTEYIFR